MKLPLKQLLDQEGNRYVACVAAMRIVEQVGKLQNDHGIRESEGLAVLAIDRLLCGEVNVLHPDPDEAAEPRLENV
jgi:hypothetical protein